MRNLASLSVLLLPLLTLTSCYTLPDVPGTSVQVIYSEGGMNTRSPVDIVVAPVLDETGHSLAPCEVLRGAFADALVRRRYSPLSIGYIASTMETETPGVEGTPVPASYHPGTLGEDAVLRVSVKNWDMSAWEASQQLGVTIEVWMVDSTDAVGMELWGARYEKTLDMTLAKNKYPTESILIEHCCELIAAELMECMPARTPRPGL